MFIFIVCLHLLVVNSFGKVVSSLTLYYQQLTLQVFKISWVRELSSEGFPKYSLSSWLFSCLGWELGFWGYVKWKRILHMGISFWMLHPFSGNCLTPHILCSGQEPSNQFIAEDVIHSPHSWRDQAQRWLVHKQVTLGHQIFLWECGLTDSGPMVSLRSTLGGAVLPWKPKPGAS